MPRQYRYFSADSHFESLARDMDAPGPGKIPGPSSAAHQNSPTVGTPSSKKANRSNIALPIYSLENPLKNSTRFISTLKLLLARARPQQRFNEQDADGIDGALNLFATDARNSKIKDQDGFLAIVQAFNDYFIEEFCAVAPDRLIGVAVMPDIGADENIAEMKRCKEKGFKAVRLHTFPSGKSFPTPEDDSFTPRPLISICR